MSTRSEWGKGCSSANEKLKEDDTISMTSEKSKMSFEIVRHSIDRSRGLGRKFLDTKQELLVSQSMRMN